MLTRPVFLDYSCIIPTLTAAIWNHSAIVTLIRVLLNGKIPRNLRILIPAMGDILPFKPPKNSTRARSLSEIHKGKTLCKSGFHKWEITKDKQFDSRQGKLVTLYICQRCGKSKMKSL